MPSPSLDRPCQGGIAAILAMDSPDASVVPEKERNIIVVRASVGARCPIRDTIRASFADLCIGGERESESAPRRVRTHACTHGDKYVRRRMIVFFPPGSANLPRDGDGPRFSVFCERMGSRGDVNASNVCGEGERYGHHQHEGHLFLVLLQGSPRLLRLTVSARIHLRTRDLAANSTLLLDVAPKAPNVRHGRQSDITAHQKSAHCRRRPSETILVIPGRSILRREAAVSQLGSSTRVVIVVTANDRARRYPRDQPIGLRSSDDPRRSSLRLVADSPEEPPARLTIRLADLVVTE
ncbi:hypothetical protein X777_07118 [Ooceraea biroi]|uniref:Uncharacterized protein n=1 Tax=Ooceraea biroi TaxID=2015173 RepID=A0A026W9F2_OOCBI|nr:hypothetical protein X777_07118 [Ooceraea biroi]